MDSQPRGPAVPTPRSRAVHRPVGLDQVTITGGPLGRWQHINASASIPLGLEQMEESGALPNLRLAAGDGTGEFAGFRFQDSDLYKQLEAVAWEHGRSPDPGLAEFIGQSAAVLERAQLDDGYLNSHYQVVRPEKRYAELEYSHEMYCAGHLFQAAVASARVGGDEKLLAVARRFADHLVEEFLHKGNPGIDGHPEVETALVELYRLTGKESYLRLAKHLVDERGKGKIASSGMGSHYLQDHAPVREADTAVGHAVRQLYLDAGIVDVYLETGEESLLECSIRRWEDTVATKTCLTGGQGSRHSHEAFGDRYELPPDRAYNETCAAIAHIFLAWRLLLLTGDGAYRDAVETALYNGVLPGLSASGTEFFYQNPLADAGRHRRQPWFQCACCPPNIARLLASLPGYLYTTSEEESGPGVWVQLYVGNRAEHVLPDGTPVAIDLSTGFPTDGRVEVTVTPKVPADFTLYLPVPGWATDVTVRLGDEIVEPERRDGYLALTRTWRAGDTV
ncbi:MAG TPA: beta-L-arabinofuranosidase domain-containing protein, partial [Actinopolymorphaceae bacterium]